MKKVIRLLLAAALLSACCHQGRADDTSALRLSRDSFCLEAHRGICNRYPENTLESFMAAAAVAGRYGGMETDVQQTSDGVLVLMHDNSLERTTDGTGKVSDYTWEELSELHIDGGYGWNDSYAGKLRIPKFADFLRICRESGLTPYVELKLLTDEGIAKTIETLHSEGFSDDEFVLTSFNRHYLDVAGGLCGAKREYMQRYFSFEELSGLVGTGLSVRPSAVKTDRALVDACRELGLEMEAYGLPVGDAETLSRLKTWGVKGATCNDWMNLETVLK